MLDMSKAFDSIMLNTELTVRCETEESEFFKTDTGVPQDGGLSANKFILYLARALHKENNDRICKKSTITTSSEVSSVSKHDHCKDKDKHLAIYQEYAGDISVITSDKNKNDHIKKAVRSELETRNLQVNETKTEECEMKRNGNESWEECKLLGSLLDKKNTKSCVYEN